MELDLHGTHQCIWIHEEQKKEISKPGSGSRKNVLHGSGPVQKFKREFLVTSHVMLPDSKTILDMSHFSPAFSRAWGSPSMNLVVLTDFCLLDVGSCHWVWLQQHQFFSGWPLASNHWTWPMEEEWSKCIRKKRKKKRKRKWLYNPLRNGPYAQPIVRLMIIRVIDWMR